MIMSETIVRSTQYQLKSKGFHGICDVFAFSSMLSFVNFDSCCGEGVALKSPCIRR